LESKLVPYRLKVADLEAAKKAEASRVENLEKRSPDREILLGKVEKERDNALADSPKLARRPKRSLQSWPKLGTTAKKLLKNSLELVRKRKS